MSLSSIETGAFMRSFPEIAFASAFAFFFLTGWIIPRYDPLPSRVAEKD